MPKLTDRNELQESPDNDDLIHIVDVSDTTDSPEGTSLKIKISTFFSGLTSIFAPLSHTHTKDEISDFNDADYASAAQGAKADTAVQPAAISNFETTTELNARDTANRSRANHTGTQPASTITGLADVATSGDYNDLSNQPDLSVYDNFEPFTNEADFPATGDADVIYLETSTGTMFRWTGSAYATISAQLALGETSATAYRGDRGKTAYDHSQVTTGNPHNVTKSDVGLGNVDNTSDANKPVSTATQTALNLKQDKSIVVSASRTAVLDSYYVNVATATYTDPSPTEGKGFIVFVRNATATVGGTGYSTAGTIIHRIFHSGAWANYVYQVGSTFQPVDTELTAIAGLTSAADRLPYFTGSGTASLATFTSAGRALVDDATASAQRTTLGLGTSATADKTGADAAVVSGTAGTDGNLVEWNADGDAVDSGHSINQSLNTTSDVTFADVTADEVICDSAKATVSAIGNSGASQTLNALTATIFTTTLTANCAFTFSNLTAGKSIELHMYGDGTQRTPTFPTAKLLYNDTTIAYPTTSSDLLVLVARHNGIEVVITAAGTYAAFS